MPAQATPFLGVLIFSVFQTTLSSRMRQLISPIWDGLDAVKYTSVSLLILIVLVQGDVTVVGVVMDELPARRVMVAKPPDASTSKRNRWLPLSDLDDRTLFKSPKTTRPNTTKNNN